MAAILPTLWFTGMRPSDALALRWSDVHWLDRRIWVRNVKTGQGRFVPLHPDLIEVLKGWRGLRFPALDERVFVVGQRNLRRDFSRLRKRASMPDVTMYDFRRTFISMLRRAGVEVGIVKELVGHKTSGTTDKHYTDCRPAHCAALEKFKRTA